MRNKYFLVVLLAVLACMGMSAQGHKNLRITEVMVTDTNAHGGYGWVELYNSSYGTYAIEKMFITNQHADAIFNNQKYIDGAFAKEHVTKRDAILRYASTVAGSGVYQVPRGDERNTSVGEHMQVVFTADGNPAAGTFHLPFVFTPGKDNYIALYDVNGDFVDEVTVPASLPAGESWAWKAEGRLPLVYNKEAADTSWEARDGSSVAKAITPGNFNTRIENHNIDKFHEVDPYGWILTVVAMLIVFTALLLLFILFKIFGIISDKAVNKGSNTSNQVSEEPVAEEEITTEAGEEEIAAIAMAMFQHFDAHDEESGVLTFNEYIETEWTSKAALMNRPPEHIIL